MKTGNNRCNLSRKILSSASNAQIIEGKILNGAFSAQELKAFADSF